MLQRVWLAQLWAENLLGVLARSRTIYEEIAHLVGRGDLATTLQVLPLCYALPVKNHVDAYLKAWSYLRPHAGGPQAADFFRLLQARAPELDLHLYDLVLDHRLWYLFNSRLFLANPCPERLWAVHRDAMALLTFTREGVAARGWGQVAEELAAQPDAAALLAKAEAELVVLRVGDARFWNPKLQPAPGAEALVRRLRRAGIALRADRRARAAEG